MNHRAHLQKDKKLKRVLDLQPPILLEKKRQVWLHLCASIMSQQLSTKVAAIIYERFLHLFPKRKPTLQLVADLPFETLRGIGLSNAKTNYVKNVCAFFIQEKITDAKLYKMDDESLIQYLTQIKGVGQWTVEMILMFTLGREDILALDDLGIQQSMIKLYNIEAANKKELKEKMLLHSKNWRPYRTYACRYLWGWKDSVKPPDKNV